MREMVHKLRKKPEAVRERYSILIVAALGVLLVLFWFFMLKYRFTAVVVAPEDETPKAPNPFTVLKNSISQTYNSVFDKNAALGAAAIESEEKQKEGTIRVGSVEKKNGEFNPE